MDSPKTIKWNPSTLSYFQNPYLHLSDCLQHNPVQQGAYGEWILFRYQDIKQILRSDDFLTADLSGFFKEKEPIILKNTNQCPFLAKSTNKWLMYLDDEQHKLARELLEDVLNSYNLTEIVHNSVQTWFNDFFQQEIKDFAYVVSVLPTLIFRAFYQIDSDAWSSFERIKNVSHSLADSQDIFVSIKKYQAINADAEWLFRTILKDFEKENLPKSTLISLIKAKNEQMDKPFSTDELISIILLLLFAANETTVDTLCMCIHEFLKKPELLEYICQADSKQINVLVEELFRFATPQQYTIRINKYPCKIGEQVIPANSRLFLCLASANRDPSVFENPDEIEPNRNNNPHLSFGNGLHACMGAKLARNELRTLLKPLANVLKSYRLDENFEVEWHRSIFMRGIKTLNVIQKTTHDS